MCWYFKKYLSLKSLKISNLCGNIFMKCWSKFAQIMIPGIKLGPQNGSKYKEIYREKSFKMFSSKTTWEDEESSLFKLWLGHIEWGLCRFFKFGYIKKFFDKNLLLEIQSSRKLKLAWKYVLCTLKFVNSWFPGEGWAQWWGRVFWIEIDKHFLTNNGTKRGLNILHKDMAI